MSDADALWLRDPLEYFSLPGVIDSNIVASRGAFPHIEEQSWGAKMCMGFILFRARGKCAMTEFLNTMKARMIVFKDDQKSVNYAALDLGIVWDDYSSDTRYTTSTSIGIGTIDTLLDDEGRSFRVTLLPHSLFPRRCGAPPLPNQTVVAHCRASKDAGQKTEWMQAANLWSVGEETP